MFPVSHCARVMRPRRSGWTRAYDASMFRRRTAVSMNLRATLNAAGDGGTALSFATSDGLFEIVPTNAFPVPCISATRIAIAPATKTTALPIKSRRCARGDESTRPNGWGVDDATIPFDQSTTEKLELRPPRRLSRPFRTRQRRQLRAPASGGLAPEAARAPDRDQPERERRQHDQREDDRDRREPDSAEDGLAGGRARRRRRCCEVRGPDLVLRASDGLEDRDRVEPVHEPAAVPLDHLPRERPRADLRSAPRVNQQREVDVTLPDVESRPVVERLDLDRVRRDGAGARTPLRERRAGAQLGPGERPGEVGTLPPDRCGNEAVERPVDRPAVGGGQPRREASGELRRALVRGRRGVLRPRV